MWWDSKKFGTSATQSYGRDVNIWILNIYGRHYRIQIMIVPDQTGAPDSEQIVLISLATSPPLVFCTAKQKRDDQCRWGLKLKAWGSSLECCEQTCAVFCKRESSHDIRFWHIYPLLRALSHFLLVVAVSLHFGFRPVAYDCHKVPHYLCLKVQVRKQNAPRLYWFTKVSLHLI